MAFTSFDLGGSGNNTFPFENIGDTVTGKVIDLKEQQQTDMKTGEPAFWPDGSPIMMYPVTLRTELRDPANKFDQGDRVIYLRGSRKPETQSMMAAVISAIQAATGGTEIKPGAVLTVTFIGEAEPKNKGFSKRKLFAASYELPAVPLAATPATPAPAPVVATPAPAAPAPVAGVTPEIMAQLVAQGIDVTNLTVTA